MLKSLKLIIYYRNDQDIQYANHINDNSGSTNIHNSIIYTREFLKI